MKFCLSLEGTSRGRRLLQNLLEYSSHSQAVCLSTPQAQADHLLLPSTVCLLMELSVQLGQGSSWAFCSLLGHTVEYPEVTSLSSFLLAGAVRSGSLTFISVSSIKSLCKPGLSVAQTAGRSDPIPGPLSSMVATHYFILWWSHCCSTFF